MGVDADGASKLPMKYTITQLAGLTLERDVTVKVEYIPKPGDEPAELNICWEPDASLFPSFCGTLRSVATGPATCKLSLEGTYDVPGGVAGQLFDAVLAVRTAQGTLEQLLGQFRDAIENDYKVRMEFAQTRIVSLRCSRAGDVPAAARECGRRRQHRDGATADGGAFIALDRGFFAAEGPNVTPVFSQNGAEIVPELATGKIDVALALARRVALQRARDLESMRASWPILGRAAGDRRLQRLRLHRRP